MYLNKEKKAELFGKYGKGTTDTGSAEAQIALFTYRIQHLTEHVKTHHKDFRDHPFAYSACRQASCIAQLSV